MNTNISDLYAEMNQTLERVAITAENILQRAERSYQTALKTLELLKEHILTHGFADDLEEIRFFRQEKPLFLKELIYYKELFHIEINKPVGDRQTISDHYKKAVSGINAFFERNKFIYAYYRTGNTTYDDTFFLRRAQHPLPLLEEMPDMDTRCCTATSFKFGKILAFEELARYLERALNSTQQQDDLQPVEKPDAIWTDAKANLIEVGYSLFSKGSVNNGKADIKLIMAALEYAFNVSLGNYYAVFNQNIRLRKKKRTVYLPELDKSLNDYMDDLDEHPRDYPIR